MSDCLFPCRETIAPEIVVDRSTFTASETIRRLLAQARSAGLDSNVVVFNEVY